MDTTWGTWRAWAALAIALSACGPAHAFYFEGWPGSGIRPQPSLVIQPQSRAPEPTAPAPQAPIQNQTPPLGPPVPIDKPPIGPHPTPEPATGLLGLVGLGALAVRKWRKKAK